MASLHEYVSNERRNMIVRRHFEAKGYRVHSGLQFGCELVLYADVPDRVHSDFCVHVIGTGESLNWRTIQTLTRSMPDLHKTLILAHLREKANGEIVVDELAIATEHAPFRHKNQKMKNEVGSQVKKKAKIDA